MTAIWMLAILMMECPMQSISELVYPKLHDRIAYPGYPADAHIAAIDDNIPGREHFFIGISHEFNILDRAMWHFLDVQSSRIDDDGRRTWQLGDKARLPKWQAEIANA